MKNRQFTFLFICSAILLFSSVLYANEVGNPGFESALGGSGNWDQTANRGITRVTGASDAPDGSSYLRLDEAGIGGAELFTYTFQRADSEVRSGDMVAASAMVRQTPDDGDDTAQVRIEFYDANDVLLDDSIGALTAGATVASFTRVTTSQGAPSGTSYVVLTLRFQNGEAGTGTADFDSVNLTINGFPIDLGVEATKNRVQKGGGSFVTIRLNNQTAVTQNNVQLIVNIPNGLQLIDETSRLNQEIPTSENLDFTRIFNIGTLNAEDDRTLSFLVMVSPGAVIGRRYTITLFARDGTGTGDDRSNLSQTRSIPIEVIADPFFDEGTVIGKVFDDRNENGLQDEGEVGVPSVRIATEQGIVIKTDRDGKYHIPALQPGRHLVKIDGHSLPQGTKFITEETYLIKNTDGLISKVDFAVKLPDSKVAEAYRKELNVIVSQGNDFVRPKLYVRMDPEVLRIGQGMLERAPVFRMELNYRDVVTGWRVEVRDERGEEVWTGHGLGGPPTSAPWSGQMKSRKLIEPGTYSYRLVVRDQLEHEDWTPLRFFKVIRKANGDPAHVSIEEPVTGYGNISRDGKRSIPLSARPTVLVRGNAAPGSKVEVNGKSVNVNSDGTFDAEVFTKPGDQAVEVKSFTSDGRTLTYSEDIKIKDTSFFMVGLGEEEIGGNIFKGNMETVGRDDQFHQGFYQKGKLAYYLKGKIKGKFLVTSRYDTSSPERNELFTNLDPEHYYPVYGDDSEVDYDAHDTQRKLYLLVEMDKSYAKYGSYQTNFNETELATFNRTLSGLKVHHETLSTTKYGDAKRGVTVFHAQAKSLADHNEFVGTGGSLYYLRNKDVIQGSEQLNVEIRDNIQGITIFKKALTMGTDYEIDYPQGRILLRKPLSSVSYSDTILSNDILNGSQVYLTVDYEFEAQDLFGDQPAGVRGFTHLGDHIRIGGTAIKETRQDADYDLRGVDTTVKIGKNTKVSAEYAHSQRAQVRNAVSYNGGITFKNLVSGDKEIEKSTQLFDGAWLVKGESKPLKGTDISGYVQKLSRGFSNADLISQKADHKYGVELRQKLGEDLGATYRLDQIKESHDQRFPVLQNQIAQLKYDNSKYLGILEYRNEKADVTSQTMRGLEHVFDRQEYENGFGAKLGYHLDNGWTPYVKGQATNGGKPNNQIGGGLEAVIAGKGTLRVEEMVGNLGDSTLIGFERQVDEKTNVYSNIRTSPNLDGLGEGISTTIGSSYNVNEESRFHSEREVSSYARGEKAGDLAGYDIALTDKWNLGISGERSRIRDLKDETEIKDHPDVQNDYLNVERNAGALEIGYLDKELLKLISRFELRLDRGDVNRNQWLTSNSLEWKLNSDYRFLAKVNKSMTIRTSDEGNLDGDFLEMNVGLAYRPVQHNKLNVLTRYTWLQDVGVPGQFNNSDHSGVEVDEASHIFGVEGVYDFSRYLGYAQKFGYKMGTLESSVDGNQLNLGTFLTVSRLNFHITRKWDLAVEYRVRMDHRLVDAMQNGFLFEIDRELLEYMRFGVGYNFTDFSDDLRQSNSYNSHGFFSRVSGKF